jgi:hypothetical protein
MENEADQATDDSRADSRSLSQRLHTARPSWFSEAAFSLGHPGLAPKEQAANVGAIKIP